MIALLADPLWLALISALGLARALTSRHATPLDVVLGRVFDRLTWTARKTRKDRPCIPAASTASTPSATRRTKRRASKAATTTNRRTASLLDALTAPLRLRHAAGQHTAALSLTWDSNQGRYRHTETGPMEIPAQYWPTRWDATTVFPVDRAPEHAGRTR